jgi:thioester reductase-like protein
VGVKPRNVFLTGATGFLGSFLLQDLLSSTDATIHCLVRAGSPEDGRGRIERALRSHLIHAELGDRVVAVPGDLSQPRFGLSEVAFASLAERTDVVLHSGAAVNFLLQLPDLLATNVFGTQEALRFARTCGNRPFHFVSTIGIFLSQHFSGRPVSEHEFPESDAGLIIPYTRSKWAAEKLVREARDRGQPVEVHRPGVIGWHSRTGAWNENDMTSQLLRLFVRQGRAPAVKVPIDIAPVDAVSAAIVSRLLTDSDPPSTDAFHLSNPHPTTWSEVREALGELGHRLAELPLDEWRATLAEEEENADPFVRMFDWMAASEESEVGTVLDLLSGRITFETHTRSAFACPRLDAALLAPFVERVQSSGP